MHRTAPCVVAVRWLLFLLWAVAPVSASLPSSLWDSLHSVPFLNAGTVQSTDQFEFVTEDCLYAEPENVTKANNAWDTRGPNDPNNTHRYLYQITDRQGNPEAKDKSQQAEVEVLHSTPPKGMRSSVPLGGISTGSFEIRSDGSFHEWTIMNQSPAADAKYGIVPDAFIALRSRNLDTGVITATPLRTHYPSLKVNAKSISYSGSYPVARLTSEQFEVYAYSTLKPLDLRRSATPAVVFTLAVSNTAPQASNFSFMVNLPMLLEVDFHRVPLNGQRPGASESCADQNSCIARCQRKKCSAWSFENSTCTLFSGTPPPNTYCRGAYSGLYGIFDTSNSEPVDTFTGSTSSPSVRVRVIGGAASLWGVSTRGSAATFSATTSHSPQDLFEEFGSKGFLSPKRQAPTNDSQTDTMFAACANVVVRPGEQRTISLIFSYFFPNRTYLGSEVGNYFANFFSSVDAVAKSLGAGQDDAILREVVSDIATLHKLFAESNFTNLHRDWFINSFSHVRSAMWIGDGRWRQFEAYDCDDLDSVHNDYQRHLPYLFYFGAETEINKMYGWAKLQTQDGMIEESLSPGCAGPPHPIDSGAPHGGRAMGDVTSVFIIQTLEIFKSTNRRDFLAEMMPHVIKAVEWQLNRSASVGLPMYMTCTYDLVRFDVYPVAAFNAVMHLTAMKACMALGSISSLPDLVNLCSAAFARGQKAADRLLWYENGGYYLAFTNASDGHHPIMGDTLYGQVLAFYLGLGPLLPKSKMLSHLQQELKLGQTPFGIRVVTGRYTEAYSVDNMIWLGGSQDWTALQIWLQNSTSLAVQNQSYIGLHHVSEELHDMWNPFGIYAGEGFGFDGKPWVTSHYGFHMPFWYIPLAMARQLYDASAYRGGGSLSLHPVPSADLLDGDSESGRYVLPLLSARFLGVISVSQLPTAKNVTISISFGALNVKYLELFGVPVGSATICSGSSHSWKVPLSPH